ncbi:MAG: hypothetical protein K1X67_26295 [Fimbriimonadaceae bacterium]|nr:hypothetical protein [Fimbriimonadaceae bacterium]
MRKSKKKPVEKPSTIADLFKYAYRETAAGRKVNLARDLWDLSTTPDASSQEIALVRELAAADPLLDALANILTDVADIDLKDSVRERILELAVVAFASHKLFENRLERLVDPRAEPHLTAAEISSAARSFAFEELDKEESLAVSGTKRERLRINAVIAFELFRVLRDKWPKNRFIADLCELVWRAPSRFPPPRQKPDTYGLRDGQRDTEHRGDWRSIAMLANARSATDALSELVRHFETRLQDQDKKIHAALDEASAQSRRAERERAEADSLKAELKEKNTQIDRLESGVSELKSRLEKEQSGRFADEIHAVNDYETLRAQVVRQLSGQVNLLSDGLHALRNGSPEVADEFVDRALTKIEAEVKRLKELEGRSE